MKTYIFEIGSKFMFSWSDFRRANPAAITSSRDGLLSQRECHHRHTLYKSPHHVFNPETFTFSSCLLERVNMGHTVSMVTLQLSQRCPVVLPHSNKFLCRYKLWSSKTLQRKKKKSDAISSTDGESDHKQHVCVLVTVCLCSLNMAKFCHTLA